MIIRKLSVKDRKQMLELMDEFWMKHHSGELLSGEIKEIAALKNPKLQMSIELEQYYSWYTYVAEEEGKLLGFVTAKIIVEGDRVLDKIGTIEELFVTKNARGMKLGQQLMEKLLTLLAHEGCLVYRTSAYANNNVAISLYKKLGFLEESIELSRKVNR